MLWVLKRNVSMRRFFEHPKHMFKLIGKKIIAILRLKNVLTWPYDSVCSVSGMKQVFQTMIHINK